MRSPVLRNFLCDLPTFSSTRQNIGQLLLVFSSQGSCADARCYRSLWHRQRQPLLLLCCENADADAVCLQYVRVGKAGVLDATVRVVYDVIRKVLVKTGKGHVQSLDSKFCF